MIPAIKEINFPEYATLSQATVSLKDMGERVITTQVKIDGSIVPDFSFDWEVEYEGERYIHAAREPQAAKENTSSRTTIDLTFRHWVIVELQRYFFVEMASTQAGTVIADKYIASLGLSLPDFINAFNKVLNYYFGDSVRMVLNPAWVASSERTFVEINYSYLWDVLQKLYDAYGARWTLEPVSGDSRKYLIKVGYDAQDSTHIFEYGYQGGLLKVERQVQSTDIRNILLGRGGDRNLPYMYFKDYEKYGNSANPDNGNFIPDPDAIPELRDIPFTQLRSAEFRSYVQGWAARHYGGTVSKAQSYVQWAWERGYTDAVFNPVEYVKDDDSIAKYGQQWGALDDNDDIYPSIQGSGFDDAIDVEQMTSDGVTEQDAENDSVTTNVGGGAASKIVLASGLLESEETYDAKWTKEQIVASFNVPTGQTGVLMPAGGTTATGYTYANKRFIPPELFLCETEITVRNTATGEVVNQSNIPAGNYAVYAKVKVEYVEFWPILSNVTAEVPGFKLITSSQKPSPSLTFDVWVANLWNTAKRVNETDVQYAERVWVPILGAVGEEAKVSFTTGLLSVSSDYEFKIVKTPVYDTSKYYGGKQSHWRLTLERSQAEYEATGKLIPNTQINAVPGDKFIFTGIQLPWQYVYWAEQRLNGYKQDALLDIANIQPTWVITIDKVRANNMEPGDASKLIEQLRVGSLIRLADKRLIQGAPLELYVQSATYTWQEPSEGSPYIYPDIEIVVSDKVVAVSNPVAQLQGDVSILQQFVGGLSNFQQLVKAIGDRLYLRKDGLDDISLSHTRFAERVEGSLFRQGGIGGRDWGFFRDDNGNAVLETDRIVVRKELEVNTLLINQTEYVGGRQVNSAAAIECIQVEDVAGGYKCYFDRKQGSVGNNFKVDDVAYCQQWDDTNTDYRYYKRKVVEIGDDYIVLSSDDEFTDGSSIPRDGDAIVQFGNYTDATRQYVIIRDVIGGGYERMLSGLDSVTASGKEYYFAGRQSSTGPRWFVGDSEGEFAEYKDGRLNIKGSFLVYKSDGVYVSLQEYMSNNDTEYLRKATNYGTLIDGGLVLTSLIQLGMPADEGYMVYSGINGIMAPDALGKGIAAWYGGPMVDREADSDEDSFAQSLFRFDGSGYLAGGNITWDAEGNGSVGRGIVSWNKDGVTLGENIKLGSSDETLSSILTMLNSFNNMFELDRTSVPGKVWIKAKYDGLYTIGGLSAGAVASGGGGGEGGSAGWGGSDGKQYTDLWVGDEEDSRRLSLYGHDHDERYYTKAWIDSALESMSGLSMELVDKLPAASAQTQRKIYLVPSATADDGNVKDEYITIQEGGAYKWELIGSTRVDLSGFVKKSGDTMTGNLTLPRLISTQADGTAPFQVTSKTVVTNLNADLLDGHEGLWYQRAVYSYHPATSDINADNTTDPNILSNNKSGVGEQFKYYDTKFFNNAGDTNNRFQIAYPYSRLEQIRYRVYYGGKWSDWDFLARTTDNVASATKLQTARKLWGQSFDGTGDVSGNMTGVGNIYASGNLIIELDNAGAWTRGIRYRMNNAYVGYAAGLYGNNATLRYYFYGGDYNNPKLVIKDDNVGIGTTSPSYKLHVAGTLYASGAATFGSTLTVSGAATFNSTVKIGGATLSWDANAGALKIDKGFYADGFITAGTPGSGGSGAALTLAELNDVRLTSPQGGQVLAYKGGFWVNEDAPEGGVTMIGGRKGEVTIADLKADLGLKDAAYRNVAQSISAGEQGLVPGALLRDVLGSEITGTVAEFVNSSISTATATFRGTYPKESDLQSIKDADDNDYAFVTGTDDYGNTYYDRYKWTKEGWEKEFRLNNSSFTAAQWASIQSGITAALVDKLKGIAAGAQVNVIESVQVNGKPLAVSSDKSVNITVPTSVSQLSGMDDYMKISDADKKYVTLGTKQTVSGEKHFTSWLYAENGVALTENKGLSVYVGGEMKSLLRHHVDGGFKAVLFAEGLRDYVFNFYGTALYLYDGAKDTVVFSAADWGVSVWRDFCPGDGADYLRLGNNEHPWAELHAKRWYPNGVNGPYIEFDKNAAGGEGAFKVAGNMYVTGFLTSGAFGVDDIKTDISYSLIPVDNNAHDIGSSSRKFRNLYIGRDAYINGDIFCNGEIDCDTVAADSLVTAPEGNFAKITGGDITLNALESYLPANVGGTNTADLSSAIFTSANIAGIADGTIRVIKTGTYVLNINGWKVNGSYHEIYAGGFTFVQTGASSWTITKN